MSYIIIHYLKSISRDSKFDIHFVIRILMGFSLTYFCLLSFILGMHFVEVLHLLNSKANSVKVVNEIVIYLFPIYCLFSLIFPGDNFKLITRYMHLPIHRNRLIFFVLILKQLNFVNLLIFVFIVPYAYINILPDYGWISFFLYIIGFILYISSLTIFTLFLRQMQSFHILLSLLIIAFVIFRYILKIKFDFEIGLLTADFFSGIIQRHILNSISLLVVTALLTIVTSLKLKMAFYGLYEGTENQENINQASLTTFLNKLNNNYGFLEMSLIFRNKRIRSIFYIVIYALILTYIIFLIKPFNDTFLVFFWCISITGIWGYSYLQFVFSMDSSFMDFIATRKFNFQKYLLIKYLQIVIVSFLLFLSMTPLVFLGFIKIHILVTAFIYNIGIGSFIVLYTATFNSKKMELSKGLLLNYQGYNSLQIAAIYFVIIFPIAILGVVTLLFNVGTGFIVINILSLFSLLFRKFWFKIVLSMLVKRKFVNLKGYRK